MQRPEITYLNPSSDFSEASFREAIILLDVKDILGPITITLSYSEFEKLSDEFIAKYLPRVNLVCIPDEMLKNKYTWCIWAGGKIIISEGL